MSILKQQRRLWFLAGTATAGLGLLSLEVGTEKHAALQRTQSRCGASMSRPLFCIRRRCCSPSTCTQAIFCHKERKISYNNAAQRDAWEGAARVAGQLPDHVERPRHQVCIVCLKLLGLSAAF